MQSVAAVLLKTLRWHPLAFLSCLDLFWAEKDL